MARRLGREYPDAINLVMNRGDRAKPKRVARWRQETATYPSAGG
jgi:hypothetical protein